MTTSDTRGRFVSYVRNHRAADLGAEHAAAAGRLLGSQKRTVSRNELVTDGPFGEAAPGYRRPHDRRRESVSRVRVVLRDPAHRPGAGLGLRGDDRDPERTRGSILTPHGIEIQASGSVRALDHERGGAGSPREGESAAATEP
jgi:hypothetical protein